MIWLTAAAGIVFVCAFLLTGKIRAYALKAGMIDVPGARSSHSVPTPRGGGLAIAACVLVAAMVLWAQGMIGMDLALATLMGGGAVALAGWLEDRRGLARAWRAFIYLGAAATAFLFMEGAGGSGVGAYVVPVLAIIGLAWLINLYNFMDGTDGLAGVQCLVTSMFAAALFLSSGAPGPAWLSVILAAAAAGFLCWNWPPARIFMGDAGSCFIGFMLGVLLLAGERSGAVPLAAWCILLSLFVCDATLTLARRMAVGEKWYSPHRTHAYQLLVQAGLSHRRLAVWMLTVNIVLLGPLAVWVARDDAPRWPIAGLVLAAAAAAWTVIQIRLRTPAQAPGIAE